MRFIVNVVVMVLLFMVFSLVAGYVWSPATFIPTDNIGRGVGVVKVCSTDELLGDVEKAVNEWNMAITYFSVRFIWPELLGLRLEASRGSCGVNISLGELRRGYNGLTEVISNNGSLEWVVTISENLPPGRRVDVIVHELSHVLGLLDSVSSSSKHYRTATDISGLGKVTSHDVYALFIKYVMKGDGVVVRPPPYIPYMTVREPLPDIISVLLAASVTMSVNRLMRGKWPSRFKNVNPSG